MDNDDDQFKPGSFGCHEALHTTNVVCNIIDCELLDHPSIQMNEDWRELANRALENLLELYQKIGNAHLDTKKGA